MMFRKKCCSLLLIGLLSATLATGSEDIVVIVSAKSTVTSLSKEVVANIYLGRSSTFPDGTLSLPLTLKNDALQPVFNTTILGKSENQLRSYWAKLVFSGEGNPPQEIKDEATLVKLVSNNPNLIGWVSREAVTKEVRIVYAP